MARTKISPRPDPARRRGTVLLLIVGALAMAAVLTVAYVAIGRADRRTGSSLVVANEFSEVPDQFVGYVGGVLADDVLRLGELRSRSSLLSGSGRWRREGTDYPFTAWIDDSTGTPGDLTFDLFDPAGARSDPWLASTMPTWFGPESSPDRSGSDPTRNYLNTRDWDHITNVAPSGMFVNLVNLRNRFDARPGSGSNRMSSDLTLFDGSGTPTSQLDVAGSPAGDPEIPANFDSRQRGMFRAMIPDPMTRPGDAEYLPNQYADADGDGFADSRWFEMVDLNTDETFRSLINSSPDMRYFFAARIVDLSALVNVNTATDFAGVPTLPTPAGFTPADVDLRRLLTMRDAYDVYGVGYDGLLQPTPSGGVDDYSRMDVGTSLEVGLSAYQALRVSIARGQVPGGRDIAALGFPDSYGFAKGLPGSGEARAFNDANARADYYFNAGSRDLGTSYDDVSRLSLLSGQFGADDQAELMARRTFNDPRNQSRLEQALGGRLFTAMNLSPVRDNRDDEFERDAIDDDGDGQADDKALLLKQIDLRQYMTALSGARPIRAGHDLASAGVGMPPAGGIEPPLDAQDTLGEIPDLMVDAVDLLDDASGANPTKRARARRRLLRLYADALLPYSDVPESWMGGASASPPTAWEQMRTLAYAHAGPELALRIAGHMTANMIDAYDRDAIPIAFTDDASPTNGSGYTLILSDEYRSQLDSAVDMDGDGTPDFPYWNAARRLDLDQATGAQRIATSDTDVFAPAVNVFGIEAQPFLTEVASFVVYTDTPSGLGGDGALPPAGSCASPSGEWKLVTGGPGGLTQIISCPITIDGNVDITNSDFLFEMIAFQITNPFDRDIVLSNGSGTPTGGQAISGGYYYVEFGGHDFMLADLDEPLSGGTYDRSSASISGIRINAGETIVCYAMTQRRPDVFDRIAAASDQIASDQADRLESWINRQLGAGTMRVINIPRIDFTAGTGATYVDTFNDLLPGSGDISVANLWRVVRDPTVESGDENLPGNDRLVDRLRDPSTGGRTLDRTFPGNQRVAGTQAGPDTGPGARRDNTGFSITLWGSIRRPDTPTGGPDSKDQTFPAYCIERKGSISSNIDDDDGTGAVSPMLTAGQFVQSDPLSIGTRTLAGLFAQSGGQDLILTIDQEPDLKTTSPIGPNLDGRAFNEVAKAEPHLDDNRFRRSVGGVKVPTLRPADLLLPMGIGPFQNPFASTQDDEWTTLGEALALAYHYDQGPTSDPTDPLWRLGDPNRLRSGFSMVGPPLPALDLGHLVIGDYALFLNQDQDSDLLFDPTRGDERAGLGIPAALAILDQLNTLDPETGGLRRSIKGKININTAPLAVLRLLPMLSPTTEPLTSPFDWLGGISPGLPDADSDIAAALLAYRDKARVLLRPSAVAAAGFPSVSFQDRDSVDPSAGVVFDPTPSPSVAPNGRLIFTGVEGIRERPGLGSVGEVLAVADRTRTAFSDPRQNPNNIDFLGYDRLDVDRVGIDSVRYDSTPGDASNDGLADDGIRDDFDERLAIANSLLNVISVRSDLYACWFIVHGYTRADVEGLTDDDEPLVPSFARRFLVIYDRSNVVEPGDQPRVVLMRELPVSFGL